MTTISIVECPRDAWQGFHDFIPTAEKIKHIKRLMDCGFHTIDAGSFVSPRAMPQMADAHELFSALEEAREKSDTQLLSIVASEGGARRAAEFNHIDAWGYPFSVSEIFQERNSRKTIPKAIEDLKRVKDLASKSNVELVVYLSMAFGNPYGEAYHTDLVLERLEQALLCGGDIISLSDTTGQGSTEKVVELCTLMSHYSAVPWGAHMHSTYEDAGEKALAAVSAGCKRIDTALKGYGGCPFASDQLIGNMPTEKVLSALTHASLPHVLNPLEVESAYNSALEVLGRYS
ncbi:MAG: hydroxymethylglutaryl-CoA lyase [Schleiferiaceae bacterium]|nr:hydroxymethylglutaryl-CoA lyase [Schleiferiaceae bacterium]